MLRVRYWTTVQYPVRGLPCIVLPAALRFRRSDREATVEMAALFSATKVDVTFDNASSKNDGMIWIPGCTFRAQTSTIRKRLRCTVTVAGFSMDCHPVTNRQFREFVRVTKHRRQIIPDPKGYPGNVPAYDLRGLSDVLPAGASGQPPRLQPVVDVRQGSATAHSYKEWRIPTKAARICARLITADATGRR
jgi:formylglycine-generating enzyme required for sulfatase activity